MLIKDNFYQMVEFYILIMGMCFLIIGFVIIMSPFKS